MNNSTRRPDLNNLTFSSLECDRAPKDLALIVLSGRIYGCQKGKIEIVAVNGLTVFRDVLSGIEITLETSCLLWAINSLETVPDGIDRCSIGLCATTKDFKHGSGTDVFLNKRGNSLIIEIPTIYLDELFLPVELMAVGFKNFRLGLEFLVNCDRASEEVAS